MHIIVTSKYYSINVFQQIHKREVKLGPFLTKYTYNKQLVNKLIENSFIFQTFQRQISLKYGVRVIVNSCHRFDNYQR